MHMLWRRSVLASLVVLASGLSVPAAPAGSESPAPAKAQSPAARLARRSTSRWTST